MPRQSKINPSYINNGVVINPSVPSAGKTVTITYDGLLSKSGAHQVYARVGFGKSWGNPYDYEMNKSKSGFETIVPIPPTDMLNICFRDCAFNWDNNMGKDYRYDVME